MRGRAHTFTLCFAPTPCYDTLRFLLHAKQTEKGHRRGAQQPNGPSRAHWHTERSDAGARPQSRERGYQRPRVRRRKARLITRTLCLDRRARTVQSLLQVALSNRRIFTHTHPSCLKGGGRLFQRHAVMSRVLQLIHSAPQLSALSPLQPACLWRVDLRCVAVLPP